MVGRTNQIRNPMWFISNNKMTSILFLFSLQNRVDNRNFLGIHRSNKSNLCRTKSEAHFSYILLFRMTPGFRLCLWWEKLCMKDAYLDNIIKHYLQLIYTYICSLQEKENLEIISILPSRCKDKPWKLKYNFTSYNDKIMKENLQNNFYNLEILLRIRISRTLQCNFR